jgi:flagellar protein FlaC
MFGIQLEVGKYGGVQIKLKLGKDEPTPSKEDSSITSQKIPEVLQQTTSNEQKEKRPEPERKIIKFDTSEKPSEKKKEDVPAQDPTKKPVVTKIENNPNTTKQVSNITPGAAADAAREELEQRRNILQNMKDFDFQIKKNQEGITNISEKVENLSKDLDDLVSLYEIVSEQMNPFVGLSKVTKKRLDALENIIEEVDRVKTRIGDLESILDKTSVNGKGNTTPTLAKPTNETDTMPKAPSTPTVPETSPSSKPIVIQSPTIEKITEIDIDDILNKSLESLMIEQNIDTMINEFFINLK